MHHNLSCLRGAAYVVTSKEYLRYSKYVRNFFVLFCKVVNFASSFRATGVFTKYLPVLPVKSRQRVRLQVEDAAACRGRRQVGGSVSNAGSIMFD